MIVNNYKSRIIDKKIDQFLELFGAVNIEGPKRLIPKMGNAPFAVFLMNSLLDWSSSFFSFLLIIINFKLNNMPFGVIW